MKGHIESSHLTKFDAFGANKDQVMDLETRFKIHTNICNVEAFPKTIQPLKIFYQICDNCRIPSFTYHLKEAEMKSHMFAQF